MKSAELRMESHEHASLEIGSTPYEVVSLRGSEGLSQPFALQLVCRVTEDVPQPQSLIRQQAVASLRDGNGAERRIHGLVAEARTRFTDEGKCELLVMLRPAMHPFTLGRNSRVFHDSTVVDIVKKVLAPATFPIRWEVFAKYPVHAYRAQYREDDWTFVSRVLEDEGIYYWFDHEGEQTTLVFSDDSTFAADLEGGAYIPFAEGTGLQSRQETIDTLGTFAEAVSTRFSVASYNPARPLLKVGATAGDGPFEVYDAPGGGPEDPAICEARARIRREAAIAAGNGIQGSASSVRLAPGRVVEIGDHPLARLDGRYLITAVDYKIEQRRRGASLPATGATAGDIAHAYASSFRAIPQAVAFRPPDRTPVTRQAGLQSGVVTGEPGAEVFPDETGRVRVQLHWDREGTRDGASGRWMRVAQRGTADSLLLPRVGWNVMTFNEEGTLDAPSVLSRIHDAEHPPPYSLPDNKTRVVFKTATTPGGGSFNEIYFEDKQGAEEMFLNASRDMAILVRNNKTDDVRRDASRAVGVDHHLEVGIDHGEHIVANQTVAILVNETASVTGDRQKTVVTDEAVTIGAGRRLSTGAVHTDQVKENRTLKVGAALLDVTLGNIAARSPVEHILAGGAAVKISANSINDKLGKASAQTIGGIKLEITKNNRPIQVGMRYQETVGGSMVLKTDNELSDVADTTSSLSVGGALSAKAPDVLIEATDKIEIRCGAASITVLPDSIVVSAPTLDLSASAHLEAIAPRIAHN